MGRAATPLQGQHAVHAASLCLLGPTDTYATRLVDTAPPLQAAMEIIFLEASQVVLEEFRPAFFSDRLFCLFFDNMQQ